ncbi:ATP-binding protein [Anaeromyxobacter oryzisoli]|uniref:ATP-binding protein n=1 Tax=Anaeromyxobacter oryzisoli TaxID=2925408 RepID=UPI001F5737B1|nr:ATP-binding protein [Anaeromyxobacter sp. SG63]
MAAPATLMKPSTHAAAPRQNRMTLSSITSGVIEAPYRLLVHGRDGVGKSTFGSNAPAPVFLGTEDGTGHLDVARFPAPETWEDVLDAIRTLTADSGGFKTLVIDSIDWAEPLLWKQVCAAAGVDGIEEVGGGYGKGYTAALDGWRALLAALERLQAVRGMHVVLLAHSVIKKFANPEGEDYERYVIAMHDKSAALVRQWAKGVYFAQFETFAVAKKKGEKVKGVSTGARLLWTQPSAAFDAKDRYFLPEHVPLDWEDFDAAVKAASPTDPEALTAEIRRKAELVGGEVGAKALAAFERHASDPIALAKINDRLNARLAEKREREEA